MIPVVWRKTDDNLTPEALRKIDWINFENENYDKTFRELVQAIERDQEHVHTHTVLQQRAAEWQLNEKRKDFLLNAFALKNALTWLEGAKAKHPEPTPLQESYIGASHEEVQRQEAEQQRTNQTLKKRLRLSQIALGIAAILIVVSGGLGYLSYLSAKAAEESERQAVMAKEIAKIAEKEALKSLEKVKAQEKARDIRDFRNLIVRSRMVLKGAACPQALFDSMHEILKRHPEDGDFTDFAANLQKLEQRAQEENACK